jgi:hypothetical protein
VHGKKIFVSIDESCDTEARYVADVIMGTLEIHGPGAVFLFTNEVLESVIIPQFVNSLTARYFYCGQRVYDMATSCFLWPIQPHKF